MHVHVRIQNHGHVASIETKLTLLADRKTRVRPAYYSENYVSLLPGESRETEISAPKTAAPGALALGVRGWNLAEQILSVAAK